MKIEIVFRGVPGEPGWWADGVGIAVLLRDWRGNTLWEHDDGVLVTASVIPLTWSYDVPDNVAGARQLAVAVQDLESGQPGDVTVDGKPLGSFGFLSDEWQELTVEVGSPGVEETVWSAIKIAVPVLSLGVVAGVMGSVLKKR